MDKKLAKYKIGLLVLILFAVAMTVLVLVQAGSTKADTKTNNTASNIADTLNNYVDSNNVIPASLAEAGVKNVPSTITYTKVSDSSYKFCVTYKGNSSGFDAGGVASDLVTGSLGGDSGGSGDNTDLTIDGTYHKGVNCQTVQPSYVTPVSSEPCVGVTGAQCVPDTNQNVNLCTYGPDTSGGCSLRCSNANTGEAAGTAAKLSTLDASITNMTGSGSSLVLTVQDSKNVTYTISVTSSTSFYDSGCSTLDPTNMAVGDQVRVAYPSVVNNHVVATEVDDLSY